MAKPGARSLREWLRYQLQTRFWQMDIDATARIATDAYIDRTNPRGIHIGAGAVIDREAIILSHDMTRGVRPHTRIGKGAIIGARAIVMPGVTVGAHCRVIAGAVVLRDLADGAVVAGNPAKPFES